MSALALAARESPALSVPPWCRSRRTELSRWESRPAALGPSEGCGARNHRRPAPSGKLYSPFTMACVGNAEELECEGPLESSREVFKSEKQSKVKDLTVKNTLLIREKKYFLSIILLVTGRISYFQVN